MEAKKRYYREENTRTSYVEGNTVRKLNAAPDIWREEEEIRSPRRQQQRHTKELSGINFTSLLILTAAIIATVYVCVTYLKLQSDVTQMDGTVTSLQQDLETLTKKNDAESELAKKNYNLDYVYRVAVEELGMVYPNKNKVITYKSSDDDYVRQYEDIPE
jgi:cell division protein FtsB